MIQLSIFPHTIVLLFYLRYFINQIKWIIWMNGLAVSSFAPRSYIMPETLRDYVIKTGGV